MVKNTNTERSAIAFLGNQRDGGKVGEVGIRFQAARGLEDGV